tara:strand:- start:1684 stop:2610 length:927 start_codon:yes stop_codon:yes gene_type:complete
MGEYASDAPSICGLSGGCDEVRNSAFASFAGIPTPALGLMFFGLLIALRVMPAPVRVQRLVATAGALGALLFLAAQAWLVGVFCRYCIIVDVSAIAYGALLLRPQPDTRAKRLEGVLLPLLAAGALYMLVHATAPSDASNAPVATLDVVREERLTITEFVDFECPACRALHKELAQALRGFEDQVDIVRKHVPLERHAHARAAARAYCCAEASGKSEEMADELFTANALSAGDCEDLAVKVAVPLEAYRACIDSELPDETIANDEGLAAEIGLRALPTFFVGTKRFEGVRESSVLVAEIESALGDRLE